MNVWLRCSTTNSANRTKILAAARQEFGRVSYSEATIRTVARAAGVDPRLVRHYFQNKAKLFRQSVAMDAGIESIRRRVLDGEHTGLGARLVHEFFQLWSIYPDSARALMAVAASYPGAVKVLRDCFVDELLSTLIAELSVDRPELRTALVASQLAGLTMLRHLVAHTGPGKHPDGTACRRHRPDLQRLLVGDLGI